MSASSSSSVRRPESACLLEYRQATAPIARALGVGWIAVQTAHAEDSAIAPDVGLGFHEDAHRSPSKP